MLSIKFDVPFDESTLVYGKPGRPGVIEMRILEQDSEIERGGLAYYDDETNISIVSSSMPELVHGMTGVNRIYLRGDDEVEDDTVARISVNDVIKELERCETALRSLGAALNIDVRIEVPNIMPPRKSFWD